LSQDFVSRLGGMTLLAAGTGRRPQRPARCHGWEREGPLGHVGDPPDISP
jgi:hypothetical protein